MLQFASFSIYGLCPGDSLHSLSLKICLLSQIGFLPQISVFALFCYLVWVSPPPLRYGMSQQSDNVVLKLLKMKDPEK